MSLTLYSGMPNDGDSGTDTEQICTDEVRLYDRSEQVNRRIVELIQLKARPSHRSKQDVVSAKQMARSFTEVMGATMGAIVQMRQEDREDRKRSEERREEQDKENRTMHHESMQIMQQFLGHIARSVDQQNTHIQQQGMQISFLVQHLSTTTTTTTATTAGPTHGGSTATTAGPTHGRSLLLPPFSVGRTSSPSRSVPTVPAVTSRPLLTSGESSLQVPVPTIDVHLSDSAAAAVDLPLPLSEDFDGVGLDDALSDPLNIANDSPQRSFLFPSEQGPLSLNDPIVHPPLPSSLMPHAQSLPYYHSLPNTNNTTTTTTAFGMYQSSISSNSSSSGGGGGLRPMAMTHHNSHVMAMDVLSHPMNLPRSIQEMRAKTRRPSTAQGKEKKKHGKKKKNNAVHNFNRDALVALFGVHPIAFHKKKRKTKTSGNEGRREEGEEGEEREEVRKPKLKGGVRNPRTKPLAMKGFLPVSHDAFYETQEGKRFIISQQRPKGDPIPTAATFDKPEDVYWYENLFLPRIHEIVTNPDALPSLQQRDPTTHWIPIYFSLVKGTGSVHHIKIGGFGEPHELAVFGFYRIITGQNGKGKNHNISEPHNVYNRHPELKQAWESYIGVSKSSGPPSTVSLGRPLALMPPVATPPTTNGFSGLTTLATCATTIVPLEQPTMMTRSHAAHSSKKRKHASGNDDDDDDYEDDPNEESSSDSE